MDRTRGSQASWHACISPWFLENPLLAYLMHAVKWLLPLDMHW